MTKKAVIEILDQEIAWCTLNPHGKSLDFEKGFVDGLRQAKRLVRELNRDN